MSLENRPQSPERESPRGLEPLGEVPPSNNFICTYGGQFAQNLLLDRPQVDKFLAIAALNGRVWLQESKVKKPKAVPDGVNPDGSVTARRSLTWGEKVEVEDKRMNPYFQVEPDERGWVISVNGDLILEDLMKSGNNAREVTGKFARKFDYYTRVGLREALLKDKLTTAKDKYVAGRGAISAMFTADAVGEVVLFNHTPTQVLYGEAFIFGLIACGNVFMRSKYKELERAAERENQTIPWNFRHFQPFRRNVNNVAEVFGLPIELDRTIMAYSYLDFKKYTGHPLIVHP